MKPRNRTERSMLECCEELHVDDGISPRHQNNKTPNQKNQSTERLCSQVQKAVRMAIAEYCLNTALSQWDAVSVIQEDGSPTLIIDMMQVTGEPESAPVINRLLDKYKSSIRRTIAETITRKRTPSIRFRLVVEGEI